MHWPYSKSTNIYLIVSVVLIIQATVSVGISAIPEQKFLSPSLQLFPTKISDWKHEQDVALEPEILDVLKADDVLNTYYRNEKTGEQISFFVAYYKSLRNSLPHSPKVCLPGSGWDPIVSDTLTVPIEGSEPLQVNRYIVARGMDRNVILFWFQSHRRSLINEYDVKLLRITDLLRYHRADMAIARVVVPVPATDTDNGVALARKFTSLIYPVLRDGIADGTWR